MLVHRTCANCATSRQRDVGAPIAGNQRAEYQHAGSHLTDQIVGCLWIDRPRCLGNQYFGRAKLGWPSEVGQQGGRGLDISQGGYVAKAAGTVRKESGAKDR